MGRTTAGRGATEKRGGEYVRETLRKGGGSRTGIYRSIQRFKGLTPQAQEFATNSR
jgi:hypothetical protein